MINKTVNKRISVKKYVVVYLDILGYKNYINHYPKKVNNFLRTTREAISEVVDFWNGEELWFSNDTENNPNPTIKLFSDNMILCLKMKPLDLERLGFLFSAVASIQIKFLGEYNLLTRGSIVYGDFYIDEDYVFGKALIDAYELEQKASMPRIILDNKLIDLIDKTVPSMHSIANYVTYDVDGLCYVDFYKSMSPFGEPSAQGENYDYSYDDGERASYCSDIHDSLVSIIKKYNDDSKYTASYSAEGLRILQKYVWLLDYHNNGCDYLKFIKYKIKYSIKFENGHPLIAIHL